MKRSRRCGVRPPATRTPSSEIDAKTQALVAAMLERNDVDHDDLVSIIFTATDDLHAQFPATAARALGLGDVPLLCARELDIVGGMPRTIRVLMHLLHGAQPRASSTTSTSKAPRPCATTCPSDA